jgi:hypothetical protein
MSKIKRLTLVEIAELIRVSGLQCKPSKDWPSQSAVNFVNKTQIFDFGTDPPFWSDRSTYSPDMKLSVELWHKSLLRLPYDSVVFTWEDSFVVAEDRKDVARYTLVLSPALSEFKFSNEAIEAKNIFVCMMIVQTEMSPQPVVDGLFYCGAEEKRLTLQILPFDDELEEEVTSQSRGLAQCTIKACMLLNTKGVNQRKEIASTKLNCKRQKNGKPALDSVTYVELSGVGKIGKGTGKSGKEMPMHTRRGHIRHFSDGEITWVRDCIVKADGELKNRVRYQVKS